MSSYPVYQFWTSEGTLAQVLNMCRLVLVQIESLPNAEGAKIDWSQISPKTPWSPRNCQLIWRYVNYKWATGEELTPEDDSAEVLDYLSDIESSGPLRGVDISVRTLGASRKRSQQPVPEFQEWMEKKIKTDDDKKAARKDRKMWTKEEDEKLIEAVSRCGEGNWKTVQSTCGLDRNTSQLSQRWAAMKKKGMVPGISAAASHNAAAASPTKPNISATAPFAPFSINPVFSSLNPAPPAPNTTPAANVISLWPAVPISKPAQQ